MTIEEIDLHRMGMEELAKYLPEQGCDECGAATAAQMAEKLISGDCQASGCTRIAASLAEKIDKVLSINIHLPESDPAMQKVRERLIEVNAPDESSPVLLTSNSIITIRILKLVLETTGTKAFLVPVDTIGYTVDNAVHESKFTPMAVMRALTDSGILSRSSSRRAVIPGLAADQKGTIERVTRWSLEVGPVSGFELPLYLVTR